MRNPGFLVFYLAGFSVLISCKSSSGSSKSAPADYEEQLGYLRPDLEVEVEPEAETFTEREISVNYVDDISEELDSVNQIIIARNREAHYEDGYTIQIYTGNDRQAANEAKEKVQLVNPELDPIITYHQPSYKVKVGQYLDRLHAHEVYESLKKEFPLALLIPERIKIDYD